MRSVSASLHVAENAPYEARLVRVPDGRRAPLALLDPVFLGYAGLILGAPFAGLCALYNAVLLRRLSLAVEAIAVGLGSWLLFWPVANWIYDLGLDNVRLIRLVLKAIAVGLGALLASRQWPHVRGHRVLDGQIVPLLWCVVIGFALVMWMPAGLALRLLGWVR